MLLMPYAVADNREAKDFTAQVIAEMREEAPEIVSLVDAGVNSSTQCFRLPGSRKTGSVRVKIIDPSLGKRVGTHASPVRPEDALVQYPVLQGKVQLLPPLITQADLQPVIEAMTDDDENRIVAHVMKNSLSAAAHRFKRRLGTLFIFERTQPSMCAICERVHQNENSLMVTACPQLGDVGGASTLEVRLFEKCRRASGHNDNPSEPSSMYKDLGSVHCSPGSFPTGADRRAAEKKTHLERVVAGLQEGRRDPHQACDKLFEELPAVRKTIYNDPEMHAYQPAETLAVKAQVGVGKTRQLRQHLNMHYPLNDNELKPPAVVRFVTFRQTFARSLEMQFPEFQLYNDNRRGKLPSQITASHAPRLIVQVESLHRLLTEALTGEPIDLLILDEVESVLGQFSSGLHRSFSDSFTVFQWLLGTAKRVICMDANLSDRTYRMLLKFRPGRPVHFHWNKYSRASGDTIRVTSDKDTWLANMVGAVGSGKKVVIASNSLREAKVVQRLLKEQFPNKRSILYSSETAQHEKEQHFANVDYYWSAVDILIYTPTVSAGVSFEKKHFDIMYLYLSDLSCDVETARQMLGRVRSLQDKEYVVCFNSSGGRHPTDLLTLERLVYDRRQLICTGALSTGALSTGALSSHSSDRPTAFVFDANSGQVQPFRSPYFSLWLETLRIQNLSKNGFAERFIDQAADTGAKIECLEVAPTGHREAMKAKKQTIAALITQEDAQAVSGSPDLTPDEVVQIRQRKQNQEATAAEVHALRKFQLRQTYNWQDPITPGFVLELQPSKVQQWFMNLEYVFAFETMEDALGALGRDERRVHLALDAMAAPLPQTTESLRKDVKVPDWQKGLLDRLEHRAIQRRDRFPSHYLSLWFLRICDFANLLDKGGVTKYHVHLRLKGARDIIQQNRLLIQQEFGATYGKRIIEEPPETCGPALLRIANAALRKTYGFQIKLRDHLYYLERLEDSLVFGWEDGRPPQARTMPTFVRRLRYPDAEACRIARFMVNMHYCVLRVALPDVEQAVVE